MTPGFAWIGVAILIIIFLIAAIRVFNPVLHPDLVITSGEGTPGIIPQMIYLFNTTFGGTILLLIIAAVAAWILTRK